MKTFLKFVVALALLGFVGIANAQSGEKSSMKHVHKMQNKEGKLRHHTSTKMENKQMKKTDKGMKKSTTHDGKLN